MHFLNLHKLFSVCFLPLCNSCILTLFLQIIFIGVFMKREKKNNILRQSNIAYSQYGASIMIANFLVFICVGMLLLFPLFGFALSFFALCFLYLGYRKYILNILNGKSPKIENIFLLYKNSISALCLKICTTFLVLIWSILFIIPGIICGLNYVFAPYILAENDDIGCLNAMEESKKMANGNRGTIFIIYLFLAMLVVSIAMIFFSLMLIVNYYYTLPLWVNITIPSVLTLFIFLVFLLPYFEIIFAEIYLQLKTEYIKKEKIIKSSSTK